MIGLPEGIQLRNFAGDLVMLGIGIDAATFESVKAGLPEEIRERLIGWRNVAAL